MNNNTQPKKSFADIAHMSALKPEEEEEALAQAEGAGEAEGEYSDIETPTYDRTSEEEPVKTRLEHTGPTFEIVARPTSKDMYDFMFAHTYFNVLGVIAVLLGFGSIGMVIFTALNGADKTQLLLFGAIAVLFIMNSPLTLIFKARKNAAEVCKEGNTITYTFSEAGFDMSRGEEYASFEWSRLFRVKEGKTGLYMYLSRNQAFLLPKADINGVEEFKSLLAAHIEPKSNRMKKDEK